MAGRNKIRWTKSDTSRLSWAVRKFNAAVEEAKSSDPEHASLMPNELSYQDVRKKIDTRQDLKREMNKLKRFLREGSTDIVSNDNNVKATAYDLNEVRIQVRIINTFRARKRKELEEIETTSRGKPLGYNIPTMGTEASNAYNPKKFNFSKMTKQSWEAFKAGAEKMSSPAYEAERVSLMMENYFKAIDNVFGKNSVTDKLKKRIKEVGIDKFLDIYMADNEAKFNYIYSKEDVDRKLRDLIDVFDVDGDDIDALDLLDNMEDDY